MVDDRECVREGFRRIHTGRLWMVLRIIRFG